MRQLGCVWCTNWRLGGLGQGGRGDLVVYGLGFRV